jgi:hypothetical protein
MRRRLVPFWFAVLTLAIFLVPASVAASGSNYYYTVLTDQCVRPMGWKNSFKVSETAAGTSSANRLTIDSKSQEYFASDAHPHWITVHTWSQDSTAFAIDGASHSLTLHRSYLDGNIEQAGRIVFRLRAWHNTRVLWDVTVPSTTC